MTSFAFRRVGRSLSLQARVVLVLVAVILPTFLIVMLAENQVTRPILEEEIKQIGITSGKNLATEILSARLLGMSDPSPAIESRIQEVLYHQPNILRIDVISKDPVTGALKVVGSSLEDDPNVPMIPPPISELVTADFKTDEETRMSYWEINVPIEQKARDQHTAKKIMGAIHLQISTKIVARMAGALWRMTVVGALVSIFILIFALSYFLRKTLANDRKLREAETQNIQLSERLLETQRQLMNMEKLAAMGQLTATFAHEIGTPLNAVGGYLQLLQEDIKDSNDPKVIGERVEIINGQLSKIEQIVKNFLQSTAKPTSQRQLVDLNLLLDRTLGIFKPRIDEIGVKVIRDYDRKMGPLRVVPLDLDQVFSNLVNNALDSLKEKSLRTLGDSKLSLELVTSVVEESDGALWAEVKVQDSGEGIKRDDLKNVLKPFFTTKRPGEGTGLGLPICQQLVHKYGGTLSIDSKEGSWTRLVVKLPFRAVVGGADA